MEIKEFTNLDILKTKRMGTQWLAKVIGCSPATIRSWTKNGMPHRQDTTSLGFNTFTSQSNVYSITKTLEWLKENNKSKYANSLEKYLNTPYECEACNIARSKNPEHKVNNATLTHRSKYGGGGYYICYDCYMNRIEEEELGVYEEDGVLRSKTMFCVVEEDWDAYSYALEYAKYKNKDFEMIVDKEKEETTFIFK